MRRWALVVLLSPDEVPDGGNDNDGGKDDRGIVHRSRGNFAESGHAEQRGCEGGPGCLLLAIAP